MKYKLIVITLLLPLSNAFGGKEEFKIFQQDTMLNAYQTEIEMSIPNASNTNTICRQADYQIEMAEVMIGNHNNCLRNSSFCEEQKRVLEEGLKFNTNFRPTISFGYKEEQKERLISKAEQLKKKHQISDISINPINQDRLASVNYEAKPDSIESKILNLFGASISNKGYKVNMYNQSIEIYRKDIYCDLLSGKSSLEVVMEVEDYRLNPWRGVSPHTAYDIYKNLSAKPELEVMDTYYKVVLMGARIADSFRGLELKTVSDKDLKDILNSLVDISSLSWKDYYSFSQFESLNFPMSEEHEQFSVNVKIGVRK